jgi:hypothetical protein
MGGEKLILELRRAFDVAMGQLDECGFQPLQFRLMGGPNTSVKEIVKNSNAFSKSIGKEIGRAYNDPL